MPTNGRMGLENVPIEQIVPNPLNPRQDFSVETEKMQEIIRSRGWETGITCYKKDDRYVILSGHRRWYAATQLKEKTIPVFVVEPPKTQLEELERLGSSQSGKVDWTPYEWSRYTFDLWTMKNKPSYRELALSMGISESLTAARIKVFRFYPHHEIEKQLEEGTLSITVLSEIVDWIKKLQVRHPKVVDKLTLDVVRANMVHKAIQRGFTGLELRVDKFIDLAEEDQIIQFIRTLRMKLKDAYKLLDDGEYFTEGTKLKQTLGAMEKRIEDIQNIDAEKPEDAEKLYYELEKLKENVINKRNEVISYIDS